MRALLPLIAAAAALAACSSEPNTVASTPPPVVSYRIPGNNVAATDAEAQNYCAQYSRTAQYQGVQAGANGNVAVYSCNGGATEGTSVPPVAAPPQRAVLPPSPAPCANPVYTSRPGVNGYAGALTPGCPTTP